MTPDDDIPRPAGDALDAALDRWHPPGPPAGFADRVVAAAAAMAPVARRGRGRWLAIAMVAATTAAAAGLAIVAWPTSGPRPDAFAARPFAARETIALGDRGVAVVEPGAALGWRRDGAALAVRQDAGDVFYRVDRGAQAPFTVTTPAGVVRVTGTCFRVEVMPMKPFRSSVLGAAAGAAIATVAVVTVYEGKVLVANPSGQAEVKAGERVTLDGTAPSPSPGVAGPSIAVAMAPAPSLAITREELLVRDRAQREQIATLSTRLKDLESAMATGGAKVRKHPDGSGPDEDWMNPSKDELLALAKQCGVKFDVPPVMRGEPMQVDPETAQAAGLTDPELAATNEVFVELARSWKQRVRGWYVEATGDAQGADQLSAHAMGEELQDKATPGEPQALQKRISHERAGLLAPPADLSRRSPFERYFRAFAALGDEAEHLIAAKIGVDKAHQVRAESGGWPMRMSMAGCDDRDGEQDGDR